MYYLIIGRLLLSAVEDMSEQMTSTEIDNRQFTCEAHCLNLWLIVVANDETASCQYGKADGSELKHLELNSVQTKYSKSNTIHKQVTATIFGDSCAQMPSRNRVFQ